MSIIKPFSLMDVFQFNSCNLDPFTETYGVHFYMNYVDKWPDHQLYAEAPDGSCIGYLLGKTEGDDEDLHGHLSCVTVNPDFRRLGIARNLMEKLERIADEVSHGYFIDLFVRKSNTLGISMYTRMGYSVYRTVLGYYSALPPQTPEDALDLRKPLSRHKSRKKSALTPLPRPVRPEDLEWH